jgi:hypothetical protein
MIAIKLRSIVIVKAEVVPLPLDTGTSRRTETAVGDSVQPTVRVMVVVDIADVVARFNMLSALGVIVIMVEREDELIVPG